MTRESPQRPVARHRLVRERRVKTLDPLEAWEQLAKGAYPKNTLRAWKADAVIFRAFCEREGLPFFPAEPETVAGFVVQCQKAGKKPATIRRYLATVARVHTAAGLSSPCASAPVRHALKTLARTAPTRQRQAKAFTWDDIQSFLGRADGSLRDQRECALLCVAYDTMARRGELVAINLEDLRYARDGSGTVLMRRAATGQAHQGIPAYLAPGTVRRLRAWIRAAEIREGAVFRRIMMNGTVTERLSPDVVSVILKRIGRRLGWRPADVALVSGQSIRVGATQDLLALDIDLASVMQSGRWKSARMPMRYGENVMSPQGAMARAAKSQGRN